MAWIPMIPEEDADDYLASLYEKYRAPHGDVDHIIKIHSVNPRAMDLHHKYYAHIMRGHSGLSRAQREMIAVTVSAINECHYWVTHHGEGLFLLTKNRDLVTALSTDYRTAPVDEKDMAMLAYSDKLTRTPCNTAAADVEVLRDAGFSDADIHDIAQTVAYYAYVNRMACGLGVELEAYWGKTME